MAERTPPEIQQAAAQIANALGESDATPLAQIRAITRLCGAEQALGWLQQAQAIEAEGGMMTEDGTRRRTPGGVYFKVVRDALRVAGQRPLIAQIFWRAPARPPAAPGPPGAPAERVAPAAQPAETSWDDRGALIAESGSQPGKVTTVKVTLIGKPGKIVEKPNFTLLMMRYAGPLPALPKGIPAPAKVPETTYVVYVGAKQWRGVAPALAGDPNDVLIIEGTQVYDEEYGAIAVFATNTTTRAIQQAKRQQQAPRPE